MLDQMYRRLNACGSFEAAIDTVLKDVVALHGAQFGNIQLVVDDRLLIAAECGGLEAPFLLRFKEVKKSDGCACGRAWDHAGAVIVPDVESDEDYAPFREIARETGYCAVQSTPLVASDDTFLGMVSTLFANRHIPTEIEMKTAETYSKTAADYLKMILGGSKPVDKALELHVALYSSLGSADPDGLIVLPS